jgi:AbrB family looped-hinge helix DNA binding protein
MGAQFKTVLSTKGQVILPKAARDGRGWRAGAKLVVEERPEGLLIREEKPFPQTKIEDVLGMLKYDGPTISVEEMDVGIAAEIEARRARGRY